MNNTVTFVTSYLKIYTTDYDENRTFEKRLELFMKIVNLDINICLFTSPEFEDIFKEISEKHPNLKVLQILNVEDSEFFKIGNQNKELLVLPNVRSEYKDHINYMFLMNAKIEYIKKAIDINPFNNSIFCWFDFSLPHVFNNMEDSLLKIKKHSCQNYTNNPFLIIPGCWNFKINIHSLTDCVCWRFCGGFFIGDSQSLINFYNVSISHFNEFLNLTQKIVWEVNYWAWLESEGYIEPIWHLADHNDTIIDFENCSVY
jgi:tetratricopeptide (TPR) repeat protein